MFSSSSFPFKCSIRTWPITLPTWGMSWHRLSPLWASVSDLNSPSNSLPLFVCYYKQYLIHGFHLKVTSPKLILFLPELPCLFLPPSFDSCFSIFLATRLGISPSALSFPSSLPLIINQWPCYFILILQGSSIPDWLWNRVLEPEAESLNKWP